MSETKTSRDGSRLRRRGGPRRWSAADKARYLGEFARSGLTIRSFCAKTGVPKATFNYWRREARALSRGRNAPGFARVELMPGVPSSRPAIVIRSPSGMATEVSGLDKASLEALVRLILTAPAR